jgi:hypothetical protein
MGRIRDFLSKLLQGNAELGLGAMSMIALYSQAKEQKVDFIDLLLTDEALVNRMISVLSQHAERMSPRVVAGMRLLLKAHDEGKLRKAQEPTPVPPPPEQKQKERRYDP